MPSIKVLAIDGGGIRGIIPAMILAEIQTRLGMDLFNAFDLIAGTSTGGIIALGIGTGCKDTGPYSRVSFSTSMSKMGLQSSGKIF